MAAEQHIINKVSVQLHGASTQSAFQLQQDMSQYLQHFLPPKLEEWLNAGFLAGQWIEIDTLQINIETGDAFCPKKLQALIEEELQKQLLKQAAIHLSTSGSSQSVSPFRAWLFWLERGHLPWWYKGSAQELEENVMAEWKARPLRSAPLLQEAIRMEVVRRRLVLQSSDRLFDALLTLLQISKNEIEQWEKTLLKAVDDQPENAFHWKEGKHHRNTFLLATRYVFLQHLAFSQKRELQADKRTAQTIVGALEKGGLQAEALLRELGDLLSAKLLNKTKGKTNTIRKGECQIMVANAGLVLLHPYLAYFFAAMGVLDESGKKILYPGKAVQLLHMLARGKTICDESETALSKIFCGIGLEEPMYTQYPVSPAEEAECRSLLNAVICNWPALKATSPEGLQETFVQRAGKLTRKDDHWLLQVEQKTVDVLLNKLQWPLSMIRLPWMQSWLQVEWT